MAKRIKKYRVSLTKRQIQLAAELSNQPDSPIRAMHSLHNALVKMLGKIESNPCRGCAVDVNVTETEEE